MEYRETTKHMKTRSMARHFLYVYRSKIDGECLYVGLTADPVKRNRMHRKSAKWFNEALPMELISSYDSWWSGDKPERRTIKKLKPKHNIIGIRKRKPAKKYTTNQTTND